MDTSDAIDEISEKVKEHARSRGEVPLKFWVAPTFGSEVSAKRSIVFGQYQANTAPIQLVDKISYKLKQVYLDYYQVYLHGSNRLLQ